jgi:hypothetical protein
LLVLGGGLVLGVALWLNAHFYAQRGPFYDSMAYYNHLAKVMFQTQEAGFLSGLSLGLTNSTVFLPWLFGALLGLGFDPARWQGVLILFPLVWLQLATGYRFFRVRGASPWRAALLSLPLVSYAAVFHFNGGLGDFRMDLPQALGFGSFLAALMVARARPTWREWAWTGAVLGLTCLCRATTPVYASMVLALVFLVDLRERRWVDQLRGYLILGAVVVLTTVWFYWVNFDYLRYYYVEWNTDANSRLPLSQSWQHLNFIYQDLGQALLAGLVLVLGVRLAAWWRGGWPQGLGMQLLPLLGALVPAGYLVLSGAGLNPFVSMVAVPGGLLCVLGWGVGGDARLPPWARRLMDGGLCLALVATVGVSLARFDQRVSDWVPLRAGLDRLSAALLAGDDKAAGDGGTVIAALYQGGVDGTTLVNHLVFDRGLRLVAGRTLSLRGEPVRMMSFAFGSETDWKALPGDNDAEKVARVVEKTLATASRVILPDPGSDLPAHHRINHWVERIRAQLESSGRVSVIDAGIPVALSERVTVYRIDRVQPPGSKAKPTP